MDRRDVESLWVDSNVSTRRNSMESIHTMLPYVNSATRLDSEDRTMSRSGSPLKAIMSPIAEKIRSNTHDDSDIEEAKKANKAINDNINRNNKISIRERLHHFTWAWFTLPMSSGGLALLIHSQPHDFTGLHTIGLVAYGINLAIFSAACLAMLARFLLFPCDVVKSMTHPREGFFFPTFFLAVATLITSTQRYLIPLDDTKLIWATKTVFWGYLAITLVLAIAQYSYLFASQSFNLQTMMPSWILPIFPVMLTGTVSCVILETQKNIDPLPLIAAGLTCQGLGFSVAMMMYAHMIGRLMQSGLPDREHRPALFINVGPPAFTALAFIGLADRLPTSIAGIDQLTIDVGSVRTVALLSAVFLWTLSFWWFSIAAIAVVSSPPKHFHLSWWPMVFPNTGFTLATISIGNAFHSQGILGVATGMSIIVLITFFFVFYHNVRAVVIRDIMYPGKDEDS